MVVSSVGCAGSDSADAPDPVNAHSAGPHDWKLTRREMTCKRGLHDQQSRSNLSLQSFALEQGSGSELGDG